MWHTLIRVDEQSNGTDPAPDVDIRKLYAVSTGKWVYSSKKSRAINPPPEPCIFPMVFITNVGGKRSRPSVHFTQSMSRHHTRLPKNTQCRGSLKLSTISSTARGVWEGESQPSCPRTPTHVRASASSDVTTGGRGGEGRGPEESRCDKSIEAKELL